MNGVITGRQSRNDQYSQMWAGGRGGRCKSIMVRPSISRGRGYAVVVKKDENEEIIIQPAPRTAKLARIGRFDLFPKAASVTDMPDSVLLKIFSYIDQPKTMMQCATVSKQWRRIINSIYVKKPTPADTSIKTRRLTPTVSTLETAKIKIFGNAKNSTGAIETASQRKEDASYREVTIRLAMDRSDNGNQQLLSYLSRLAAYLTPKQACLLADVEVTDALIAFLFTVWQPKLIELRLLRCSLQKISTAGFEILKKSRKLKNLYIDYCPLPSSCPLADSAVMAQLGQSMTRLELCFHGDESAASIIDNQFLERLADGWKTKSDIRWLKLRAPLITADGIETLIGRYFKLRFGSRNYDPDGKTGFTKVPKLILWLCDTAVDVDDLLNRRSGRKWFQEQKLQTTNRRKIRDAYTGGEDVVIWVENTSTN